MHLKAFPGVVRRFWDHIRDGMSAAEAGEAVGVSVHTGRKWFADAGGVRPKFSDQKPHKWHRLTLDERVEIKVGLKLQEPIREIARRLDRAPSTIMREIERKCVLLWAISIELWIRGAEEGRLGDQAALQSHRRAVARPAAR